MKEAAKCRALCPFHHAIHSQKQMVARHAGRKYSQGKDALISRARFIRNSEFNKKKKNEYGYCSKCNLSVKNGEEAGFQWDHLNPNEKKNDVSKMMRGNSLKLILTEINKCRLLCQNCAKTWDSEQRKNQKETGFV